MATLTTMFRKLLNVNTAIFTNTRIETNEKGVTYIYVAAIIAMHNHIMSITCAL